MRRYISYVFMASLVGLGLWDLWFHAEWTEAERFWARLPHLSVLLGSYALIVVLDVYWGLLPDEDE